MELLLTGSTGFVGRNLISKIVRDTSWQRIILPVRDPEKLKAQLAEEGIAADGRLIICRVSGNFWEIPEGVRPDLVIHSAGLLFGRSKEAFYQTNVEGSIRLVSQLPHAARVIVLSSLAARGPTPSDEEKGMHRLLDRPVSFYGASKLSMERELRNRLGSRLLILRPPMVLGPRDSATLPLFKMASGSVRIKPGFFPKYYSWIAVDDLCEAILKAASAAPAGWQRHDPYHLTSGGIITDSELIAVAGEVLGIRGVTVRLPHAAIIMASFVMDAVPFWRDIVPSLGRDRLRELLPNQWVCDRSSFANHFDWQPRRNLRETLAEAAEWCKGQGKI